MKQDTIHRIARERFDGWKNCQRFTQLMGADRPTEMKDAYAIQSALYDIMREEDRFTEFGGHKVALTSPAIKKCAALMNRLTVLFSKNSFIKITTTW